LKLNLSQKENAQSRTSVFSSEFESQYFVHRSNLKNPFGSFPFGKNSLKQSKQLYNSKDKYISKSMNLSIPTRFGQSYSKCIPRLDPFFYGYIERRTIFEESSDDHIVELNGHDSSRVLPPSNFEDLKKIHHPSQRKRFTSPVSNQKHPPFKSIVPPINHLLPQNNFKNPVGLKNPQPQKNTGCLQYSHSQLNLAGHESAESCLKKTEKLSSNVPQSIISSSANHRGNLITEK
jgi:hypothetical protein